MRVTFVGLPKNTLPFFVIGAILPLPSFKSILGGPSHPSLSLNQLPPNSHVAPSLGSPSLIVNLFPSFGHILNSISNLHITSPMSSKKVVVLNNLLNIESNINLWAFLAS